MRRIVHACLPRSAGLVGRPAISEGRVALASMRCLSLRQLAGVSLRACRRTMSGTSSLPMPRPSKSSSIVTREWSLPVERLDGDVDDRSDRAFDPVNGPAGGRIELGDLRGRRPLRTADPTRGHALRADGWCLTAFHAASHHALLPFDEGAGIGGVGEHLVLRTGDLDRGDERCHQLTSPARRRTGAGIAAIQPCRRRLRGRPPSRRRDDRGCGARLDAGALGRLGDEPDLNLAGLGRVGLDLPLRVDVPADQNAVGRS